MKRASRLEVGIVPQGLYVGCRDHGLVAVITQGMLGDLVADPPGCEECAAGKEHTH